MAAMQLARLLVVVLLHAVIGYVDATGKVPGAIAADGIYDGRLDGINVQAIFDMGGVTGYIQFSQKSPSAAVEIHVNLAGLDQFTETYQWHVHDYPIRSGLLIDYPCSSTEVGGHYDPRNAASNPDYDTICNQQNPTLCEIGDFSNKLGYLNNEQWQTFTDTNLNLYGSESIIGRSLVIHRGQAPNNRWICANIEYLGARVDIFRAPVYGNDPANAMYQGDVIIHKVAGRDDATIYADIRKRDQSSTITLNWNLRLGAAADGRCEGFSNTLYGESSEGDYSECSTTKQRLCRIGDFTGKCGTLDFTDNIRGRRFCTDNQLGSIRTSDIYNPDQPISVVLDDAGVVVACGVLEPVQPQIAYVEFKNSRIFGQIYFYQSSPNDRTYARTYITGITRRNVSLAIYTNGDGTCNNLGSLLRKPNSPAIIGRPVGATKTGDAVVLGNLSTKLRIPPESQSYRVTTTTPYLPLFGPYSIVNNTLALIDSNGVALACGGITRLNEYPSGMAASILGYQNIETTK